MLVVVSSQKLRQLACVMACLALAPPPLQATTDFEGAVPLKPFTETPDYAERKSDGSLPQREPGSSARALAGVTGPSAGQPAGSLSGRIVYMDAGHGWTYFNGTASAGWDTQRGIVPGTAMVEDYGNLDQMTMFAFYCFNAGATVVPFRPIGYQTNEVVLDNTSAGVTFAGAWSDSTSTVYYGPAGATPYRFASISPSETATATYTPIIPVSGFYPVYAWARNGPDRTSQLYRINHTGGQSTVRVPHYMVGSGWVYLGSYYFNAGSNTATGAVVISNLQPNPLAGTVVIADAVRFGNGMGDVVPTPGGTETPTVSGYPREEECARYWVQRSLGQGQSSSIYNGSFDDATDSVGAPPRMASEMNREASGTIYKRIFVSFHSNSTTDDSGTSTTRGCEGLYNNDSLFPGTATSNQFRLAQLIGQTVNDELAALPSPPLEFPWHGRSNITYARDDYAFGEIRGDTIDYEMDATIIEVAYHDNLTDSKLLRDPRVRNAIARASYHSVIKYMNEFDGVPLLYLPEPPGNIRAIANGAGGVTISWNVPVMESGSGAPAGYVVCRSTNGYGFGNPVAVAGGASTSVTLSNLAPDQAWYFRVAATNAAGESFTSATAGCRRASNPTAPRVLFVNGFERFDRTIDPHQTPAVRHYVPPGSSGTMDRVIPRAINSFDYVVQHGQALSACNVAFDSCQKQALNGGNVVLTDYPAIAWEAGNQSTADETFSSSDQTKVAAFLNGGGHLFVSGAEIAWDLDRPSGPTSADRTFLHNQLHALYAADSSGSYTVTPASGSIFSAASAGTFDEGDHGGYVVGYPDVLTATGAGTQSALNYAGGTGGSAGVQYNGASGGGKVVYLGFPFEALLSAANRMAVMSNAMNFFIISAPPSILTQPQGKSVRAGSNVTFTVTATGAPALSYQWRFNGEELPGATSGNYSILSAALSDGGSYSVIVSNYAGSVTSSNAILTVTLPAAPQFGAIQMLPGGGLKLLLSGETGAKYSIQTSTNLLQWVPLASFVLTNGTAEITDYSVTNGARRFYRAVAP